MFISRLKALIRIAVVACAGIGFAIVGTWGFALLISSALQTGRVTIVTVIKGRGITWSHTYGIRDHMAYFTLGVLTDVSGAVTFVGLGAILLYAAVRVVLDPSGATVSARARRIGAIWAFACLGSFILFLVLQVFPYLLKYRILP
jgi:hypothetical protein